MKADPILEKTKPTNDDENDAVRQADPSQTENEIRPISLAREINGDERPAVVRGQDADEVAVVLQRVYGTEAVHSVVPVRNADERTREIGLDRSRGLLPTGSPNLMAHQMVQMANHLVVAFQAQTKARPLIREVWLSTFRVDNTPQPAQHQARAVRQDQCQGHKVWRGLQSQIQALPL